MICLTLQETQAFLVSNLTSSKINFYQSYVGQNPRTGQDSFKHGNLPPKILISIMLVVIPESSKEILKSRVRFVGGKGGIFLPTAQLHPSTVHHPELHHPQLQSPTTTFPHLVVHAPCFPPSAPYCCRSHIHPANEASTSVTCDDVHIPKMKSLAAGFRQNSISQF